MPEEAVFCVVSLDGVPLCPDGDEEACWREASSGTVSFHDADGNYMKTLNFGPEGGKTTLRAQLAAEAAHESAARPEDGRRRRTRQLDVSQEAPARRTGGRLPSCLRTSIVATDWYDKPVLRDDGKGDNPGAMRYLRNKATTKAAVAIIERELRFFRKHRRCMRYASLKAKGCGSGIVRQQGAGQPTHETSALGAPKDVRTYSPSGRCRAASTPRGGQWSEHAARTTA